MSKKVHSPRPRPLRPVDFGKKKTSSGSGETVGSRKKTVSRSKKPSKQQPPSKHQSPKHPLPKHPGRNQLFAGESSETGIRLQKILAVSGFGSRRDCEELITTGRVEIDRRTVTELGTKVDPIRQEIRVDGESLRKVKPAYFAVYKPKGYVCSHVDPSGRPRAIDLVPEKFGRVFPVGRLDLASEGLLLMTNDGVLAERLTHPRYEVAKKYRVQVAGLVEPDIVFKLKKGVRLAEGLAKASGVTLKGTHKNSSILEIELKEGKNREIRRLLARLNHKVIALLRVAVGPVKLGKMLPGEYRLLTHAEVDALYRASEKS